MKNLIKTYLILTFLFILLLQIDFLRVSKIYFFDGIYLLIASTALTYPILKFEKNLRLLTLISAFSLNFAFFVLFPVSYERSVTVQLLTNLSESKGKIELSKIDIQNEIIKVTEKEEFTEKRIFEQLYTGYINETESGYEVSNSINNFINTKKIISKIYNIDN